MAGKNVYANITELIKDYNDLSVNTYLNQEITVGQATLTCDIYRVADETVLTSAIFTGCTQNDANTQIIIGKDMSVASGTTLIPPYRCKGLFIGDVGTFTNEGTISMTARGASATGVNIPLFKTYQISATGGAGGTGNAGNGASPTTGVLGCGGGGAGSATSATAGVGAAGTSFSGGPGGGGAAGANGTAGSSTGGAGGNGAKSTDQEMAASGGSGNPAGRDAGYVVEGPVSYGVAGTGQGTGGLIVIMAINFVNDGTITSAGVTPKLPASSSAWQSRQCPGGASGGGCVVAITREASGSGILTASGGAAAHANNTSSFSQTGGAGGDGTATTLEESDLVLINLPFRAALSDMAHIDNVEPIDGARVVGLIDKDELMYEYAGERHRAMPTNVSFDDFPQRGEQVPDELEILLTNVQNGQILVYDSISQKFKNRDAGHVYSASEKIVGYWIDGKPLYERTYSYTSVPSTVDGSWQTLEDLTSLNMDTVVLISGLVTTNSSQNKQVLCLPYVDSNVSVALQISPNRELYFCNKAASTRFVLDVYVTIQYTKTTDTASS